MAMYRINVSWQNWPGAPGVTTFFQNPAVGQPNPEAVRVFFDAIRALLPLNLSLNVPGSGDMVEETTGELAGTWQSTPAPAQVVGATAGTYAGNAGGVIHWLTQGVVNNRRVRGRSFLVPLVGTCYENNGSLSAATLTTMQNAATALMNATPGHLVVWSRPVKPTPGVAARAGSQHAVSGIRVPDLAVSLRSRRV